MTSRWQFVLTGTNGADTAELTHATNRKITWMLDGAATATFDISGRDPQAAEVAELASDLVVYHGGVKRFRGRLGSSSDTLDGTAHAASFSAVDYRGMLARRIIWPGKTIAFSQVEQTGIAWTLISDTQALGTLGITHGSGTSPVLRDRNYNEGDGIGGLLDDLGRVDNGYDWEVDANLRFNTYWPQRGLFRTDPLEYGVQVSGVTRTVDTTNFANAVRYSGDDTVAAATAVQAPGPEGRWEIQQGDPSVTIAQTVIDKANWLLATDAVVTPTYSLTLSSGWWDPSKIWLGDTVRFLCRSGRLDVDSTNRVTQVDVAVDDQGRETVTLTHGAVPLRLGARLTNYAKRLTSLERR